MQYLTLSTYLYYNKLINEGIFMKKIIIIGCPGSGKSTFSLCLSDILDIPVYHLDNLYWNADKTTVSESVFLKRLKDVVKKDEWIIDGSYGGTLDFRMKEADTIFFFDLPVQSCLEGVKERIGKSRPDMPWIETKEDPEFTAFIKNYPENGRIQALKLMQLYPEKEMHIFMSHKACNDFLQSLTNEEQVV